MSTTSATLKNKSLPPKENALFKRILKCYEQKLYKNGLKFAKQILNNPQFVEHAETLAMKGLILNALGRRDEAYANVRRALKNDLRSHTCWHVYGLLQKAERKYDEAIKCYRNALKWDPLNIQIMRELSIVQVHTRDLHGYRDTRNQLFSLKPAQRASWIGFAISYHLLQDYKMANRILDEFRKTQAYVDAYDYENSELLLYQNTIYEESGAYSDALAHSFENEKMIYDKRTLWETQGRLYFLLNRPSEAVHIFEKLVESNIDNVEYFRGLERSLGIENCPEKKLELYKKYETKFPWANLPRRLPLDSASGSEFTSLLRPYILLTFNKGVPPLFTDLQPLYAQPGKASLIQTTVHDIVKELEGQPPKKNENASALLWAYYYLAQHYDYLGNRIEALSFISLAISHTPTLIELLSSKARILKHSGDFNGASDVLEEAREMDTADRYLNSKSAKYLLRANKIEEAAAVCGKFTREGSNPVENLNEMQCMWFQTESALAYQRTKQYGEALKKCHEINRHFNEIMDDEYDFHTYCLRKMTLRSYVQLLRLEDVLRAHPFFFKAAKCAIEVYIHLYDNPHKNSSGGEQTMTENLSASELKKFKNKERKAKLKAEQEKKAAAAAAEKKELHAKSKQADDGEYHPPPSVDFNPESLEKTNEPLEQAIKFLDPLQIYGFNRIETHLLSYEIYKRKDKPLLMLRSLKRGVNQKIQDPKFEQFLDHFQEYMKSRIDSFPEPLPGFLKEEMGNMYELAERNRQEKSSENNLSKL